MAKNNHYTSDHWKVGGTGFSGENILHEVNKQQYAQADKAKDNNASLIPGQDENHLNEAEQIEQNETPAPQGGKKRGGNATSSSNSSSSDF